MTRLIHLASYTPNQRGSFIPFVRAVLGEARTRGWSVEAVFPEQARGRYWIADFEDAEIPVRFVSGSRRSLSRWLGDRVEERAEPTILHTHFTQYDVPAALVARKRANVHVYWHIHTILLSSPSAIAANAVKFWLYGRYVSRILSPATNVAESVVRRLGDRRKVSVLPNAIDPDGFPTLSAEQRLRFRRQLGVPASAQALLHLGRNWEIKGGQVFLDALAILVAEGISVVGLFNQAGVEARRHIERRGLGDSVKMIGLMPDPQVLYGAADALVAPSRGETMPYAVMEALCSGTPVVASDLPGHTVLGDALDACAIVPRDAGQVAAASRSFLEMDAAERAAQCHAAREWIAAHFGLETAVERLIEDYRGTLDGSAEPRGLPGPAR